jgi:hypothetical protein
VLRHSGTAAALKGAVATGSGIYKRCDSSKDQTMKKFLIPAVVALLASAAVLNSSAEASGKSGPAFRGGSTIKGSGSLVIQGKYHPPLGNYHPPVVNLHHNNVVVTPVHVDHQTQLLHPANGVFGLGRGFWRGRHRICLPLCGWMMGSCGDMGMPGDPMPGDGQQPPPDGTTPPGDTTTPPGDTTTPPADTTTPPNTTQNGDNPPM